MQIKGIKRRREIGCACVVAVAIVLFATGCGSKKEPAKESQEYAEYVAPERTIDPTKPTPLPGPEADFKGITDEMMEAVPDIKTLTEEQFFAFELDEFRAFVKKYAPNFRSSYSVTHDYFSPSDWSSLRYVMAYQLFGTTGFSGEMADFTKGTKPTEEPIVRTPTPGPKAEEEKSALDIAAKVDLSEFSKDDLKEMIEELSAIDIESFRGLLIESYPEAEESIIAMSEEDLSKVKAFFIEAFYNEYTSREE